MGKVWIFLLLVLFSTGIVGCAPEQDQSPPTADMVKKFVERMERVDREGEDMMQGSRMVEEQLRAGQISLYDARKEVEKFEMGMDFFSVQMDMLDASGELLEVRTLYKDAYLLRKQGMTDFRDYLDQWDPPFGKKAADAFAEADKKIKAAKEKLQGIRQQTGV